MPDPTGELLTVKPPSQERSELMARPQRERVGAALFRALGRKDDPTSIQQSLIGKAERSFKFEEGKPLAKLAEKATTQQDGTPTEQPSILDKAKAYNPTAENPNDKEGVENHIAAQSDNLRSVVTVLEAMASPEDDSSGDEMAEVYLDVLDQNLRIAVNGQFLTRSEWEANMQDPALSDTERTQLQQGIWQFIEITPPDQSRTDSISPEKDPGNPDAKARDVANDIMRREIQHLEQMVAEKQANKENTDAQRDQLLTLKIAMKANGKLGDLLRAHVLQQALDHADETGVAINPDEVRKFYEEGRILQDPTTQKFDIITTLKKYNGSYGIDEKFIDIFKKYDGDVTQILEDAKITLYREKEKNFRELFFGSQQPEDFKELQDLIDPHRTDLAKHLTKRGSLWILILAAALGKGFVEDVNPIDQFSKAA